MAELGPGTADTLYMRVGVRYNGGVRPFALFASLSDARYFHALIKAQESDLVFEIYKLETGEIL